MQEERGPITIKQVASSFGASGATGLAKASPGVAVGAGAAEMLSTSVQDLITYGTLIYIAMMVFYSLPKVWETVRYFRKMWGHRKEVGLCVSLVQDSEITQKIQEMRIRDLEREVVRLQTELSKRGAKEE
jgi:hypothetical protein